MKWLKELGKELGKEPASDQAENEVVDQKTDPASKQKADQTAAPTPVISLSGMDALRRDLLGEELGEINGKIKRVEIELAKIADKHPGVQLLMTIPGVGIRTAEAVVAYVDKIERFSRMKQLGTYFGLVPCQDASANVNRLGHITREGPATVRKMLCEAGWQAVRRSRKIRGWFDRIVGNDPDRRKIANVAVARKLIAVMGAMLRSGEAWREQDQAEGSSDVKTKEPCK
jgi:transposase